MDEPERLRRQLRRGAPRKSERSRFSFGFGNGTTYYNVGITPTEIRVFTVGVVVSTIDNTTFHDYELVAGNAGYSLFVDNVLMASGGPLSPFAINRIHLGDGTSTTNARAEVTGLHIEQDCPTPARNRTWGQVKTIYR
jgi:hypothetical protein